MRKTVTFCGLLISNTLLFQLLYPLLTTQHEPTFSGAVCKQKTIELHPKADPHSLFADMLLHQKKWHLECRLQDGMSVPEPNQKLQSITATQHALFYKEMNLSTSHPCSSLAVLVQLFARLSCSPALCLSWVKALSPKTAHIVLYRYKERKSQGSMWRIFWQLFH